MINTFPMSRKAGRLPLSSVVDLTWQVSLDEGWAMFFRRAGRAVSLVVFVLSLSLIGSGAVQAMPGGADSDASGGNQVA